MYGETRYVYHSDKSRQYFGKYNNVTNDIEFGLDYNGKTGQVWKRDEKIMSQFVASTSANVSAHSSTATSPDIEGSLKVANLSHSKSMTASTATQNSTIDVEKEEAGNHTTFPVYLTFP